jgi:hypothetical protein
MDPSPPPPNPHEDTSLHRIIHELYASLTVVKGQAQMLRRWAQRSTIPDKEVVLARLAVIDTMVNRLVGTTSALEHEEASASSGDASDAQP